VGSYYGLELEEKRIFAQSKIERKLVSPRSHTQIVGRQGVIVNGRTGVRETWVRVRMLR